MLVYKFTYFAFEEEENPANPRWSWLVIRGSLHTHKLTRENVGRDWDISLKLGILNIFFDDEIDERPQHLRYRFVMKFTFPRMVHLRGKRDFRLI